MKRKRVAKSNTQKKSDKRTKNETIVEDQDIDEDAFKVEAIVSIRQNKQKKLYEANIKWEGYEAKDNTWESLDGLYENWDFEGKDAYVFFEKNKIDVSNCEDFDFFKKTHKKGKKQKKDVQINKKKDDGKNKSKRKKLAICPVSHKVNDGNLKMECDGSYAKVGYFLHNQKCVKCNATFVSSGKNELYKVFKVGKTSPAFICTSMNCAYYICEFCHTAEILDSRDSTREKRQRKIP